MLELSHYEERILSAACQQFAAFGFYGSRVDLIAAAAKLNKRVVYEYSHTKEGLYMAVLSHVSRRMMTYIDENLPKYASFSDAAEVYEAAIKALEDANDFVRLWAWEVLSPTIHGPRIIEAASNLCSRLRILIEQSCKKRLDEQKVEQANQLFHGFLLTVALYMKSSANDTEEESEDSSSENEDTKSLQLEQYSASYEQLRRVFVQTIVLLLNGNTADGKQK